MRGRSFIPLAFAVSALRDTRSQSSFGHYLMACRSLRLPTTGAVRVIGSNESGFNCAFQWTHPHCAQLRC